MFKIDEIAFKKWFSSTANSNVSYATARLEAWKEMEELYQDGEAPCFELQAEYTVSGKTETFCNPKS